LFKRHRTAHLLQTLSDSFFQTAQISVDVIDARSARTVKNFDGVPDAKNLEPLLTKPQAFGLAATN